MTKYEFGVMSCKYELEADDMYQAYIAISLFIKQNIPIAVYSPMTYSFMPKDILENNMDVFKPEEVKKIFLSIKKVV